MENAAKALTIAGGVLIAVMLAVLVYYVFTQWGESQKMQQEDVDTVKIEEFNKSYLSYEKVLYGSELLGQQYTSDRYMWGRITKIDVSTYKDTEGNQLAYAAPSNLSPASEDYEKLIAQRVEKIRKANPEKGNEPIPVDLVTNSGSGLDPDISVAAAKYQVERLARENNMTKEEVNAIIDKCTNHKVLGLFGEETVNVLKVNLMLDKII